MLSGLPRSILSLFVACFMSCLAAAQLPEPSTQPAPPNPLVDSTMSPAKTLLFDLEARFAKAVAEKGGAAFQDWFAPDGVLLGNAASPVVGLVAIGRAAQWSPNQYQLSWTPTDALMDPSGDMGYTWGHYEGRGKDIHGNPIATSGRYICIWRRQPGGEWKIVLDASSSEPPSAGECCRISPTDN
jgi:ketosteroid isomerase-like protein